MKSDGNQNPTSLGNLFLGALLVVIGALFLLDELDIIPQTITLSWNFLWPILVIYIGITFVPIRTRNMRLLCSFLIVLLVATIGLLLLKGCGSSKNQNYAPFRPFTMYHHHRLLDDDTDYQEYQFVD